MCLRRLHVRAGLRVLGRKEMFITGICRLRLFGIDSLELSSPNAMSNLSAAQMSLQAMKDWEGSGGSPWVKRELVRFLSRVNGRTECQLTNTET